MVQGFASVQQRNVYNHIKYEIGTQERIKLSYIHLYNNQSHGSHTTCSLKESGNRLCFISIMFEMG